MSIVIVIPARYGSTRLPAKPIIDILGKPMIQHVYERALQVTGIQAVMVATDDERVASVVNGFGGHYIMTSANHLSGTDRLVEVMHKFPAEIYLNLQGDEPLVRPMDIESLIKVMAADPSIQVGTLCHALPVLEARNPNTVKVVVDANCNAMYFSRSQIPFPNDQDPPEFLKHIGVYAYRREVLQSYGELPHAMLERAEKLEQLRLLAAGVRIKTLKVEPTGPGVDTPECLERVRRLMAGLPDAVAPQLSNVRLVITDVDGVLTDGSIIYNEFGECMKRFHVRDGLGVRLLEESGVRVAVLSGRDSASLRKRVLDLGITLHNFGVKDKAQACAALIEAAKVTREQTVCIGDDTIDLPAFTACGLSFAVADAPDYVKNCATGVLKMDGGHGAFRELADKILRAQGKEHIFESADGFKGIMNRSIQ